MKTKPRNIDEYLALAKPEQRSVLQKLRLAIHAAAPGVEEHIRYGIAAFHFEDRPLVYLGAWANHCSFYPLSSAMAKAFHTQLKRFATSKGTIRFTLEKPLPVTLLRKLVKARIAENAVR
jgi:uncharacterized protein YdhG (YjbR/CyaY superfamily)